MHLIKHADGTFDEYVIRYTQVQLIFNLVQV